MSALFFKVSWPQNVEKFRELQRAAKAKRWGLAVKNVSRTRGIPVFMFFLDRKDGKQPQSFHSLGAVQGVLISEETLA